LVGRAIELRKRKDLSTPVENWLFRSFGAGTPTKNDLNTVRTFLCLYVLGCWVMAPIFSHSQAVLPNPGTLVLERIHRHDNGFEILVTTRQPASQVSRLQTNVDGSAQ
jgi:hypothetical protein